MKFGGRLQALFTISLPQTIFKGQLDRYPSAPQHHHSTTTAPQHHNHNKHSTTTKSTPPPPTRWHTSTVSPAAAHLISDCSDIGDLSLMKVVTKLGFSLSPANFHSCSRNFFRSDIGVFLREIFFLEKFFS